jgi:hypothetical protein
MLFRRKPRWLRHGVHIVGLDRVDCFSEYDGGVYVCFNRDQEPLKLKGVTIDDVEYFLKRGKPRKA